MILQFNKTEGEQLLTLYTDRDPKTVLQANGCEIRRWQTVGDMEYIEVNKAPDNEFACITAAPDFGFAKSDIHLRFDMDKMFTSGSDEHPSATAERLDMNIISYNANTETKTVDMVVFDGYGRISELPDWAVVVGYERGDMVIFIDGKDLIGKKENAV